jgi:flavin reductase (DIM6/NTAB) family NADH-FMN oxidoreductase RutF
MLKHVLSALGGAVVGAAVYSMREKPEKEDEPAESNTNSTPTSRAPPPSSAFFVYCEDNAERAKQENPGHHQIQGVLQQEWEGLSDAERQPYEERHAARRAEYEAAGGAFTQPMAFTNGERFELPEPGPMLPPVPAVILGVAGDESRPPDLTIVWSFVLDGPNGQIGISVGDDSQITFEEHAGLALIRKHRCFTLNVPDAGWIEQFDRLDMTASTREDKLAAHGLTLLESVAIKPETPGIAEAAVVLECEVVDEHRLPPCRSIFFANVVRTTVHPGVTDADGRLDSTSRPFFGMTAGNGEFWTWAQKVGHIGMR